MSTVHRESGYFWLRRIQSLAFLFLSAAFILFFLIPYSFALGGPEPFDRLMGGFHHLPLGGAIVLVFVLVPLVVYLVMGAFNLYSFSANVVAYPFYRNWMYFFQKVTGLLLVAFVGYHLYATYLTFAFSDRFVSFAFLQQFFSPVWVKVFYGVGLTCVALHIGNGFTTTLNQWGVTASKRSSEVTSIAMWVVTLVLAAWGIRLIFAF